MSKVKILVYQRRAEKDLTLMELERLSGVGKSTINNIENGTESPRLSTLHKLAQALNCKISDLYSED